MADGHRVERRWINAVVTLLALIAAFAAARASWRVLKIEQGRDAKRDQREAEGLLVRNGSELPIYDARIRVFHAGKQIGYTADVPVIPPGEQKVDMPGPEPGSYFVLGIKERKEGRVDLRFRDTAGREWQRDEHGVLTKTGIRAFLGVASERDDAGAITDEVDVHLPHGTDEA